MSANRQRSVATAAWTDTAIGGRAPLRRYPATGGQGAVVLLLRLRAVMRRWGERRGRPGGPSPGKPGETPRRSEREAHWDDPALWMLMLH